MENRETNFKVHYRYVTDQMQPVGDRLRSVEDADGMLVNVKPHHERSFSMQLRVTENDLLCDVVRRTILKIYPEVESRDDLRLTQGLAGWSYPNTGDLVGVAVPPWDVRDIRVTWHLSKIVTPDENYPESKEKIVITKGVMLFPEMPKLADDLLRLPEWEPPRDLPERERRIQMERVRRQEDRYLGMLPQGKARDFLRRMSRVIRHPRMSWARNQEILYRYIWQTVSPDVAKAVLNARSADGFFTGFFLAREAIRVTRSHHKHYAQKVAQRLGWVEFALQSILDAEETRRKLRLPPWWR